MTATSVEKVNGKPLTSPEPRFEYDPVALAEAEAIRTEAEGKAKAAEILAAEEAEVKRIANERSRMKLEKEQAAHKEYLAEKAEKTAKAKAGEEKAAKAAADAAGEEAARVKEQERTEQIWKWGARAIYAVGLVIAAPVQFIAFWDPQRKFLVAAPALLEGLALVLACGAAWAVAHRRDVRPYRIGIMLGAAVAAGINLWHGITDEAIGLNAGLIGALASLGGPIVLMAYEHGIAQKADGIPSRREKKAAEKKAETEQAARDEARAAKKAAEEKAGREKELAHARAVDEQARKDADRRERHPDVWEVADALRAARGSTFVTEQIWAETWLLVTGCKTVGIRPEIEAQSRAAQAHMRTVTEAPVLGSLSQITSQMAPRRKKDPNAPDGRRHNGGTPPVRRAGDTQPYSPLAKKQASIEQTTEKKD